MLKSTTCTPLLWRKLLSWNITTSDPPFGKKNLFAIRTFMFAFSGSD
jgi:hypothetical protein